MTDTRAKDELSGQAVKILRAVMAEADPPLTAGAHGEDDGSEPPRRPLLKHSAVDDLRDDRKRNAETDAVGLI